MNKYEIIDMIDQGAYGIVWKATNKQTGALVAIKQFKEGDDDQISRKNIQRQIRMLKMLKSQFIVNIKQAFKKKNKYFPKNLLNIIQLYQRGLDPALINKIAYKIIKCLRFLHQKNIIHRDIKPENILLQNNAEILKLCDFGFSRFLPENNQQLTQYVATRWYRSPQLLVGDRYGKAADIWALGCIIGELVNGQPMFPGQNQMDQLFLIRKSLGELPDKQIQILKNNQKYQGMKFPVLKKIQTVQARYIGKIQKKALSFMKACLSLDPNTRITVQQALTHPYLIDLTLQQNELMNQQTNLLYTSRKLTKRNSQIFSINNNQQNPSNTVLKNSNIGIKDINQNEQTQNIDQQQEKPAKTKFFSNKNNNLKVAGGGSLPQNSIYKVAGGGSLPQNSIYKVVHQNSIHKISKKFSQVSLKYEQQKLMQTKIKPDLSPKFKFKKQTVSKMLKVMSEQKKFNYNIDLKLNINLKLNQKLKNTGLNTPMLYDSKLPEIKAISNTNNNNIINSNINANNSKMLKYRLNTKYPGANLNTIYNSYGNLSILGQSKQLSKQLSKGFKKPGELK